MEEPQGIDLTYVTERIITLFCPPACTEETYLRSLQEIIVLLQFKHGHNYMVEAPLDDEQGAGGHIEGPGAT